MTVAVCPASAGSAAVSSPRAGAVTPPMAATVQPALPMSQWTDEDFERQKQAFDFEYARRKEAAARIEVCPDNHC